MSISLPRDIADALAKEAEATGVSKSGIVLAALDEYFEWLAKIEAARLANPAWAELTDSEVEYEIKRKARAESAQASPRLAQASRK